MAKTKGDGVNKKNKNYFSKKVEEAIIEYNNPKTSPAKKSILYETHIYPALKKLVENIIHINKYYNFEVCYEDTQHEVVAKLTEKLPKFSPSRGKAFSFFDRSCRNYLISYNKRVYKKKIDGGDLECIDQERDLLLEESRNNYLNTLSDFITLWVDDLEDRMFDMFFKSEDVAIADSVLILFKTRETLDFFNKKALYILIKERARVSDTNSITSVVNILKEDFFKKYNNFEITGRYD